MRLLICVDAKVLATVPPRLFPQDCALVVNAGGRTATQLRATIELARDVLPGRDVYLQTGFKRINELAHLGANDGHIIDVEQSTWDAPYAWSWDFETMLAYVLRAASPVRESFGLVITGAPLINLRLRRLGVEWDYRKLVELAPLGVTVQTQGFLARSPLERIRDAIRDNDDYSLALSRLRLQVPVDRSKLGVEVSMGDSYRNGVSPSVAVAAIRAARRQRFGSAMLFGRDGAAVKRVLDYMGMS